MIKAKNNRLAELIFLPYITRLTKKHFSHLYFKNVLMKDFETHTGLVLIANHFSWWDGFFVYFFCRFNFPGRKIRMMMLEDQLKRFWFFRYLGCFSINSNNPKSIKESIAYAAEEIGEKTVLVIFPQGKIEDYAVETIHVKNGLRFILNQAAGVVFVLPLVFKIVYTNSPKPFVTVAVGDMIAKESILRNEIKLHALLEKLRADLDRDTADCKLKEDIL